MEFQINREHNTLVLCGGINVETSPALLQALRDKRTTSFALNLKAVTALDSAGVATLIEALRLAQQRQQPLILHDVPACVSNALELAGVTALFSTAVR